MKSSGVEQYAIQQKIVFLNNFHTQVIMLYSFLALPKTEQKKNPQHLHKLQIWLETSKNSSLIKYWPVVNTSSETKIQKNSLERWSH